jgi:hypothetical protein
MVLERVEVMGRMAWDVVRGMWLQPLELMEMNDIGHGADRDGWLSPPES